jgi:hypothetical protein
VTLYGATTVLQAFAALFALALAHRRADHRPVALFLTLMTLANALRWALHVFIILPAQAIDPGAPLHGLLRAAAHLDHALFLLWPAGIAALMIAVFLGRRPWPIGAIWVLAVAAIVASYPEGRAWHPRGYLAAELGALLVSTGVFLQWLARREGLTPPRLSALFIAGIDFATLLGPYRSNLFATWDLAQAMYAVLYAILIAVQGGALWMSLKPSRSP